ncbi:hypothetical protein D3C81_945120 [compost metagenome]
MKFRDTDFTLHQTGDIILTKSSGKLSEWNLAYQRKILNRNAVKVEFTHAFLCLSPGIYTEATIGKKVDLFTIRDIKRESLDSEKWVILRNSIVSSNEGLKEMITSEILFHFSKKYNFIDLGLRFPKVGRRTFRRLLIQRNNEYKPHTFCSEFVSNVYKKVNHVINTPLFNNPSNSILPSQLIDLIKYPNWSSVYSNNSNNTLAFTTKDWIYDRLEANIEIYKRSFANQNNLISLLDKFTEKVEFRNQLLNKNIESINSNEIAVEQLQYGELWEFIKIQSEDFSFVPRNFKQIAVQDINRRLEQIETDNIQLFTQFINYQHKIVKTVINFTNQLFSYLTTEFDREFVLQHKEAIQDVISLLAQLPLDQKKLFIEVIGHENGDPSQIENDFTAFARDMLYIIEAELMNKLSELLYRM